MDIWRATWRLRSRTCARRLSSKSSTTTCRLIDLISVVRDMSADKRLKYVRFNRRSNVQKNCDNGDYPRSLLGTEDERIARRLWDHEAAARCRC